MAGEEGRKEEPKTEEEIKAWGKIFYEKGRAYGRSEVKELADALCETIIREQQKVVRWIMATRGQIEAAKAAMFAAGYMENALGKAYVKLLAGELPSLGEDSQEEKHEKQ